MKNTTHSLVSKLCLLACVSSLHTSNVYAQIASQEEQRLDIASSDKVARTSEGQDFFAVIPGFDKMEDEAEVYAASEPSAGEPRVDEVLEAANTSEIDDDFFADDISDESEEDFTVAAVDEMEVEEPLGAGEEDYQDLVDVLGAQQPAQGQEIESLISESSIEDNQGANQGVEDILTGDGVDNNMVALEEDVSAENSDIEDVLSAEGISSDEDFDDSDIAPPPPTVVNIGADAFDDEDNIEERVFGQQEIKDEPSESLSILDAFKTTSTPPDLQEKTQQSQKTSEEDSKFSDIPAFLKQRNFSGDNSHIPAVILSKEIDRLFVASAGANNIKHVRILLESGRSPNVVNTYGVSPLLAAVDKGHERMVRYLLARGAAASIATKKGVSPLHVAIDKGNKEIVRILLRAGADVNARTITGLTPLMSAINSNNEALVSMLVDADADVNLQNKEGYSALHIAAYNGNVDLVNTLLSKEASPMVSNLAGMSPADVSRLSNNEETYAVITNAISLAEKQQRELALERLKAPLTPPDVPYALMDIDDKNKWDKYFTEWIDADKRFGDLTQEEKTLWNNRRAVLTVVFADQFTSDNEEERVAINNHLKKWEEVGEVSGADSNVIATAPRNEVPSARDDLNSEIVALNDNSTSVAVENAAAEEEALTAQALYDENEIDAEEVSSDPGQMDVALNEVYLIDAISRFDEIIEQYDGYSEAEKAASEKEAEELLSSIENTYAEDFARLPDAMKTDFILSIEQWMAKASLEDVEYAEVESSDDSGIEPIEAETTSNNVTALDDTQGVMVDDVIIEDDTVADASSFQEELQDVEHQMAQQRKELMEDVLGIENEEELVDTPDIYLEDGSIPTPPPVDVAEYDDAVPSEVMVESDTEELVVIEDFDPEMSEQALQQEREAELLSRVTPDEVMAEEGFESSDPEVMVDDIADFEEAPEIESVEVVDVMVEDPGFDENEEVQEYQYGEEDVEVETVTIAEGQEEIDQESVYASVEEVDGDAPYAAQDSVSVDDFSIPSVTAVIERGKVVIDDGSGETKLPWLQHQIANEEEDYTSQEIDSIASLISRIKKSPGELGEMRLLAEEQLRLIRRLEEVQEEVDVLANKGSLDQDTDVEEYLGQADDATELEDVQRETTTLVVEEDIVLEEVQDSLDNEEQEVEVEESVQEEVEEVILTENPLDVLEEQDSSENSLETALEEDVQESSALTTEEGVAEEILDTPERKLPASLGGEIYSPVGSGSEMKIIYFGDDSNEVPPLPSSDQNYISPSAKDSNGW